MFINVAYVLDQNVQKSSLEVEVNDYDVNPAMFVVQSKRRVNLVKQYQTQQGLQHPATVDIVKIVRSLKGRTTWLP